MKKIWTSALLLSTAILFTNCTSTETAEEENTQAIPESTPENIGVGAQVPTAAEVYF